MASTGDSPIMPELAEVEFFRKQWEAGHDAVITEVVMHERARIFRDLAPKQLREGLTRSRLIGSRAHGKQLWLQFRPNAVLGIHLGMTGKLSVEGADFTPGKHDHLVLRQKKRSLVFADSRMFGKVRFEIITGGARNRTAPLPSGWDALPPEVLSDAFTVELCRDGLRRRSRTPIKAALLDQALFPGIGNWMADEILWQIGIEPHRLCGDLDEKALHRIHHSIRFVSAGALATIGHQFNDAPAEWLFSRRWRKGGHCPRCGTALERETLRGRTTCWCPTCQKTEGKIKRATTR